ncbi:MAG: acyloxyacyl hydrolase [Betaproteobacteria bacterium]|nr:acyloxyacyl hydrolase [Betaproteobacteria bacterium]
MRTRNIIKSAKSASLRVCASLFLASMVALTTASVARAESFSAPTGIAVLGGYGSNVDVAGAEVYWDNFYSSTWLKDHGLVTRLVAEVGYWHSRDDKNEHSPVVNIGVTPQVRWLAPQQGAIHPFLEAGIGVRLLSHTQIDERRMAIAAQFGERLGAGFSFGPQDRYETALFLQHVSNGRIKQPNNGFTYLGLALRMKL